MRRVLCSSVLTRVEDALQHVPQEIEHAVRVTTILIATVKAIFITATEAFAEVVLILIQPDIIAIVAIGGVLVGIRILVIEAVAILAVGLSSLYAFSIAVVEGLANQ